MTTKNTHLVQEGDILLDDRMLPETKEYVKRLLKEANPHKTIKLPIEVIRSGRLELVKTINSTLRFDNLLPPRDILIENKIDKYQIPAKVFQPKEVRENSPLIVYYHGGGWSLGSNDTHYHTLCSLASATRTVWVSVEYRLGPEYKFKTQITDYRSSFEWIAAHKSELGVSANAKLGVCGDSAGGHISTLLSHEYKSQIDFRILVYPCVHLGAHFPSNDEFSSDCHFLVPPLLEFFFNNYLESADMAHSELVSPLLKTDFDNLPPALIILAELDPLNDQAQLYHKKLIEHGNKSELKVVKGTIHSFFHSGLVLKKAFGEAKDHIVEFLDKI